MSKVRPGPRPRGPKGRQAVEYAGLEKSIDAPTIKQRRLMKGLVAGKGFKEAALEAGYSEHSARTKGGRLLRSHHWAAVLRRAQLTDPILGKRLNELVHAKAKKYFQSEGTVIESPEFIDWDARARGLDMALTIREAYPKAALEASQTGPAVTIIVHGLNPAALRPAATMPVAQIAVVNAGKGNGDEPGG